MERVGDQDRLPLVNLVSPFGLLAPGSSLVRDFTPGKVTLWSVGGEGGHRGFIIQERDDSPVLRQLFFKAVMNAGLKAGDALWLRWPSGTSRDEAFEEGSEVKFVQALTYREDISEFQGAFSTDRFPSGRTSRSSGWIIECSDEPPPEGMGFTSGYPEKLIGGSAAQGVMLDKLTMPGRTDADGTEQPAVDGFIDTDVPYRRGVLQVEDQKTDSVRRNREMTLERVRGTMRGLPIVGNTLSDSFWRVGDAERWMLSSAVRTAPHTYQVELTRNIEGIDGFRFSTKSAAPLGPTLLGFSDTFAAEFQRRQVPK